MSLGTYNRFTSDWEAGLLILYGTHKFILLITQVFPVRHSLMCHYCLETSVRCGFHQWSSIIFGC